MRIERDKAIHNISYRKLDKSDRAGIEKLATELHNFHARTREIHKNRALYNRGRL